MKTFFVSGMMLLLSTAGFSDTKTSFMPENNLHLDSHMMNNTEISKDLFEKISDNTINALRPYAKKNGASDLIVEKAWDDETVNAYAKKTDGNWIVHMYGGLARRNEVTADGFALVVCHELGHHLGGYAFYSDELSESMSVEGQSDYYATQACARLIWKNDTAVNAKAWDAASALVKGKCSEAWTAANDRALCARTIAGGQSLANLLAALGESEMPKLETPDTAVVSELLETHPDAQCRLDTYAAGALCSAVKFDFNIIPGRLASGYGENSVAAENAMMATSCSAAKGHKLGNRPTCWFKPFVDKIK